MQSEYEQLRILNIEIAKAETRGDTAFFEDLLAPAFAMRRADGTRIVDRGGFMACVAESAERATEVESITVFEANRAVVVCLVVMKTEGETRRFHNVRIFTRQATDAPWKLLAWANEPAG